MVIVCPLVYIWGFYICMHTTMANENYENGGKKFLKCKECGEFKELDNVNWYPHNQGFMGVLGRCKECILRGRKTEHELEMARKRDRERYYNNQKRREYIFKTSKERAKRNGYIRIYNRVKRQSDKLGVRPDICPICGYKGRIVAHHPDYSKPYEVVFCCQICHDRIHRNKIECPKPIDLKPF